MSSSEIEDVLSQVRRLVSDDLRPVLGRDGVARGGGPASAADKLLLTPALRVVPQSAGSTARKVDAPDDGPEILSLQTAFDAALRAEAARRALHAPPPFGLVRSAPAGEASRSDLSLQRTQPVSEPGSPVLSGEDVTTGQASAPTVVPSPALASLHDAERIPDASWAEAAHDPDGEAPMHIYGEFAQADVPMPFAQVPGTVDEFEASLTEDEAPSPAIVAEASFDDADQIHAPSPLADPAVDGRSRVATPGDDIVGAFASVRARHGAAWADRAAAEAAAQIAKGEPGAQVFDPDQEMTFDEEVLRDLVRDILREQLQGALGKRITRNVRKLVRAELNRALIGRDTD